MGSSRKSDLQVPLVTEDHYTAMQDGAPPGRLSAANRRVSNVTGPEGQRRSHIALPRRSATRITAADIEHLEGQEEAGLTSAEAAKRLEQYGRNEVAEAEVSILMMFLKQFYGMMPFCILACWILCVIAADWVDVLLIGLLLIINAVVGFHEEHSAYVALQELRDTDVKTARVKRDGQIYFNPATQMGLPIEELVPGDIISIKIGDVIPADCMIVEGECKMDTKAVTGEPLPWKVPRDTPAEPPNPGSKSKPDGYAVNEKGKELWGGCDVTQGECTAKVIRTGATTIVGEINQALGEKAVGRKSDFEMKILQSVKVIISVALVISVAMALCQSFSRKQDKQQSLDSLVALLIGSVPVALPLVLLVTMAMGSKTMANEKALVSDLAALQDIASMTCLNSDKTGTLTTGYMEIITDRIACEPGFEKMDVLEMCVVCSNRANADDAIDGAIIRAWDKEKGGSDAGEAAIKSKWKVTNTRGFNNAAKRVECTATDSSGNRVMIVKGLIGKILKNNGPTDVAEDEDESHTRYECKDYERLKTTAADTDKQLATDGWKTIAVGIRRTPEGPVEFAGIVPMLDPPRDDASLCIKLIREAGVKVKMVTGDHKNIAATTAGIIGLGTNILPNTDMSSNSGAKLNQLVLEADGFAQVMPNDKETVVLEEQAAGWIVGFCGDGMNDALALNRAQVGIAVADAMDAAIKASAIQLLDPGLACIYTAIVESRKIFRRVKSYVIYRFAATIQVVCFLSVSVFASGCQIDLIYIVMLALINDISMMPLSTDIQKAAKLPDQPVVWKILLQAFIFGIYQALLTVGFFYIASSSFLYKVDDTYHIDPKNWFSYRYSQGGTDGTMAKAYDSCIDQFDILQYGPIGSKNPPLNQTFGDSYCPINRGVYEHAKLPFYQECCVENATLKHPGEPHFGSVDSVCTELTTTSMFVELLVSSEFMIFPVRALGFMWGNRASTALYIGVIGTTAFFSIIAALGVPHNLGSALGTIFSQSLGWANTGIAWAWACGVTVVLDFIKYAYVMMMDGSAEEIEIERVADALGTEKAMANENSRKSTVQAATEALESDLQNNRADAEVGATMQRPSLAQQVGNLTVPGKRDPASIGKALMQARMSQR
jgi:H+-transporting ATPase